MSVNTANEYTYYLSKVHDEVETLGPANFTSKEVMFLLEMTYFQQSDVKINKKNWSNVHEMLDKAADDGDIPVDEIRKKNIPDLVKHGQNLPRHAAGEGPCVPRPC
jgi:hypothetical protein